MIEISKIDDQIIIDQPSISYFAHFGAPYYGGYTFVLTIPYMYGRLAQYL